MIRSCRHSSGALILAGSIDQGDIDGNSVVPAFESRFLRFGTGVERRHFAIRVRHLNAARTWSVARTKIQITPAKATAGDRIRIAVDIKVHPGFGSMGGGVSLLHTPSSPNHHITKLSGISPIAMANCHTGHRGWPAARHVSSDTPGIVTSFMCHPSALACPSHVSSNFRGSSLMPSF
jgi:hypothetical protein